MSCLKVELFFCLPVNSEIGELSTVLHIYFRRKILHLYFLTEFMKENNIKGSGCGGDLNGPTIKKCPKIDPKMR